MKPSNPTAVVSLALGAALWLGVELQLLVVVPERKTMFDEFGLQLPYLTKLVVNLSTWAVEAWWWHRVVLMVFAMPGLVLALLSLTGVVRSRAVAWAGAGLLLLPPAFLNLLIVVAWVLPSAKLAEGLAK